MMSNYGGVIQRPAFVPKKFNLEEFFIKLFDGEAWSRPLITKMAYNKNRFGEKEGPQKVTRGDGGTYLQRTTPGRPGKILSTLEGDRRSQTSIG